MDLITKSIQRAFTAKCVAEVREETDKKQISNPVTVDTSKVLYEEISQEDKKVIASIEGQLQEKRPLLTINITNLKAPYPCGPNYHDVLQNPMYGKICVNSKLLEVDYLHSWVHMDKRSSLNTGKWLNKV